MSEPNELDEQPDSVESDSAGEFDLECHYIKSNGFRVIHVDGMIGGPSPAMDGIVMALFSERDPIPLRTVHRVSPDGTYTESEREGRDGITREVDVNAIMSVETAEMVGRWLLEKAAIVRQYHGDPGE